MKVKGIKSNPLVYKKVRDVFRKRKGLSAGMLSLGGLAVSVVLFFAVFNYGRYLYNSGQTQHFVPMLKDLSAFDFSFIRNYTKGQLAELDEMKIDIKFKHLLRIEYLRDQAVKEKFINPAFKEEEFPAKLAYKGKTYDVKIALTGMVSRTHLGNPAKWSFEVKARGDNTIAGMKRFAMLVPTARGYMTDWLSFELMKERGLMGMRVDFAEVSINGKSSGVFYMEERFDKHLIENNALREGIIFKLEKELQPYRESKLMAEPDTRAQVLLMKRLWQDVMAGDLPPSQFFDMEKMAKLFVITDLMNNQHPLNKANLRFYFNPVTGLAEPIAREFEDLSKRDPADMRMFLEKPIPFTRHYWLEQESILGLIYNNDVFKRLYIQELEVVCQEKFLDGFFARNNDKLNTVLHKVYRTLPFYKFPKEQLYANQQHIRAVFFPEKAELIAWLDQKQEGALSVRLENQQDLPLEVSHLSWKDHSFFPEKPLIIDSRAREGNHKLHLYGFRIPAGLSLPDSLLPELKVHYHKLGLETGKKAVPVFPASGAHALSHPAELADRAANYAAFSFIKEKAGENTITIPAGQWALSSDLVIPGNKRLQIEAGARIDLSKHARVISYSPVFSLGTEQKPVVVTSSDGTGEGLAVIQAGQRSYLSHTHFERLSSGPEEKAVAVAFYESPVTIFACSFSASQGAGDFLAIVRADFSIDQSQFKDIQASAFGCGNCSGAVAHSSFVNIGKDAMAFSGAEVDLSNIFMNQIGEKGISAGQGSEVSARWLDIRNAAMAVASENRSRVLISDTQLANNQVGIHLSQDRPGFEPAYASAERVDIQQSETPYSVGAQTELVVNGKPYLPSGGK